ncbi:hypothetical protein AcV7_002646 [Taiwanofungus camphoratus]|nr:hypothetical protein AcV7_002646 [Antrodia cinnamomea]
MRIRQYFISSSPLWDAQRVSLTVASTFLAGLCAGDRVQMAVRASSAAFRPPAYPSIPMMMFAAASGLLHERAA